VILNESSLYKYRGYASTGQFSCSTRYFLLKMDVILGISCRDQHQLYGLVDMTPNELGNNLKLVD
jgi:hypothetical protein